MHIYPDCIPCILQMSLSTLRRVTEDTDEQKALLKEILTIPALRGQRWDITSAEVVEEIFRVISTLTGNKDPYQDDKKHLNESLLKIYKELQDLVTASNRPIEAAISLSIIGNSMDAMVHGNPVELIDAICQKAQGTHLPANSYTMFEEKLKSSKSVIIFGDNAGEIVLDKLLIQTVKEKYPVDFVYVVRSEPTLTDVTCHDAQIVGIGEVATFIENGINGPLPGTIVQRCSENVRQMIKEADLIISKGGGNFDTLSEASLGNKPCFFLLACKCNVYCAQFNTPINQPVIHHMLL